MTAHCMALAIDHDRSIDDSLGGPRGSAAFFRTRRMEHATRMANPLLVFPKMRNIAQRSHGPVVAEPTNRSRQLAI